MSSFTAYLSPLAQEVEEAVFNIVSSSLLGERRYFPLLNWDEMNNLVPERVQLITSKAESLLPGDEGWDQMGVDLFLHWEGVNVAVDITTGASTAIKNKKKKLQQIKHALPADKVCVLTIRRAFSQSEWEDFLLTIHQSEEEVIDFRLV